MSEPDGDTLLMATSAIAHPDHAIAMEALRPVLMASTTPMVLVVRGTLPAHDAKEFGRLARRESGRDLRVRGHRQCHARLRGRAGRALRRDRDHVPYSGTTPAFGDLMGGHIDFMVMGASPSLAQQQAVRMLAVTTRQRSRLPALDRLPTIAETLGSDFDHSLWQAIYAPARVPATTLATLEARFRRSSPRRGACRARGPRLGADRRRPDAADKAFRAEAARFAASPAR
jgi:tripartite-type tricarboxylate transporter receptor subunit TctC